MKKHSLVILLVYIIIANNLKAQNNLSNKMQQKIESHFEKADAYMESSHYDSAQLYLDSINQILPIKQYTLFNYSLSTRQSEVYYYNNLQQLGLQESYRSLAIATKMNDSLLLADSYNFLGLFLLNMDSLTAAVAQLKKGIQYLKTMPKAADYKSLSMPHHLHGNLAEAYFKLLSYDSALLYNNISLQLANQYNTIRGVAVAYELGGEIYVTKRLFDSATIFFNKSIAAANQIKNIDVKLLSYAGLAKVELLQQNNSNAENWIAYGIKMLAAYPIINKYFALRFLQDAALIYKTTGNNQMLVKCLTWKSEIDATNLKSNNKQLQSILKAGLDNEKRLLTFEVQQAVQERKTANTRLLITLFLMALGVVSFLIYRYFQKQKSTANLIRQKISQDLHDEIGASLSSLQIYGTVAENFMIENPTKAKEMLQKIKTQSNAILENMSDIVWSMKTNETNSTSLEIKIKNFATELLQDKSITLNCNIEKEADIALENMNARRNILAIVKEVLNNTYKYSQATELIIKIYIAEKNWVMQISDNGIGFNTESEANKGNGLRNIEKRVAELNGTYKLQTEKGAAYIFIFPLTKISNTGWN